MFFFFILNQLRFSSSCAKIAHKYQIDVNLTSIFEQRKKNLEFFGKLLKRLSVERCDFRIRR